MKKQTSHQLQYQDKIIPYQVIPSEIKNIYIYIREGKVIVKVPKYLKEKTIQEMVSQKAEWIEKKLEQEKLIIETPILQEDREKLEIIVKNKIQQYSELLKEKPNQVRIRDIKYAWGSCSSNRNITINLKLANKYKREMTSNRKNDSLK